MAQPRLTSFSLSFHILAISISVEYDFDKYLKLAINTHVTVHYQTNENNTY